MPRWVYGLLLFAPVALIAKIIDLPPLLVFIPAAISLIPLAGMIGTATEHLAQQLGPRYGGLLNATFGNAAELIIALLAVRRGLLTLVKASLTGSIIGNTLLILGLSLLVGGAKNGRQQFDQRRASMNAAMMILAVAALYLPATFRLSVTNSIVIEEISLLVAGVLLLTYFAYLYYSIKSQDSTAASAAKGEGKQSGGQKGEKEQQAAHGGEEAWSKTKSLAVLGAAVVGTAVISELLVQAVEPVTKQLGWTEFFVGVIIVPLIGNAAEHYSAIQMAWRNRLEVSLAIVAGSSAQIALLVAPLLVFISLLLGQSLNLIFVPMELLILGLATAIFAYISIDGESNWLEGVQLLALYVIAAITFFFLPVSH